MIVCATLSAQSCRDSLKPWKLSTPVGLVVKHGPDILEGARWYCRRDSSWSLRLRHPLGVFWTWKVTHWQRYQISDWNASKWFLLISAPPPSGDSKICVVDYSEKEIFDGFKNIQKLMCMSVLWNTEDMSFNVFLPSKNTKNDGLLMNCDGPSPDHHHSHTYDDQKRKTRYSLRDKQHERETSLALTILMMIIYFSTYLNLFHHQFLVVILNYH